MATRTIEPGHSGQVLAENNQEAGLLSRSLVLNWELIAYVVIFVLAVFTRFYMLGDRTMSHDESLHTVFSNDLFANGNYKHNPMMHGPILFHATALSYALFGVDDATSRIYPAVLGVLIVMFPLLLRRWLGRTGAILAATMLLISPLMLYYSRYIRHDMPSILSGMLMFWAAMMYISGPRQVQRKPYWLYILAAAMLWNLGSKETAFIYVALFGLFLTIYWLVRMAQHFFGFGAKMLFYTLNISILLAGVMSLALIIVITITFTEVSITNPYDPDTQAAAYQQWNADYDSDEMPGQLDGTLQARLWYTGEQFGNLFQGQVSTAFATFLAWTGMTFVLLLLIVIGTGIWAYRHARFKTKPWMILLDTLVFLVAIGLIVYLTDAWSHTTVTNAFGEDRRLSTSAAALGAAIALVGSGLLVYATFRIPNGRGFLRHLLALLALTLVVVTVLVFIEELSHVPSRIGTSQPSLQPVPGTLSEDPSAAGIINTDFKEYPIVLVWAIAAVSIAFILYTKAIGWWRHLQHFPEFDVLMIMGSLILPWLTAVFIVMLDSSVIDWVRIANGVPWLVDLLPVAEGVDAETGVAESLIQTGIFVLGALTWLPMAAVAVIAGLAWNWRRWLVAALIFHVLFALFFTTVFTNPNGLNTGMVYSLQYWMEQQGERRGDQPQYYYTNVIMPIYEFLPMIGSFLAMLAGMVFFWRVRRERDNERLPEDETNGGLYGLLREFYEPEDVQKPEAFPETPTVIDTAPEPSHTPLPYDAVADAAGAPQVNDDDVLLNALARQTTAESDNFIVEDTTAFEEKPMSAEASGPQEHPARPNVYPAWMGIVFSITGMMGLALAFINGFLRPLQSMDVLALLEIELFQDMQLIVRSEVLVALGVAIFIGSLFGLLAIFVPASQAIHDDKNARLGPVDMENPPDLPPEAAGNRWRLDYVPFLLFLSWWGVTNMVGYTLAGEKMPWLGTHLTVPLILLAGWYFGRILERIEWGQWANYAWLHLLILPLALVGFVQMLLPLLGANPPFEGTTSVQLGSTYSWLAAVVLFLAAVGGVTWLAYRYTGWHRVRRMFALVVFVFLAALTFRSAWMANYINYDLATEFLVYAHAGPANKFVTERLEEWSVRTTGGAEMRIMHDNRFAWPGTWYVRDFLDNDAVSYVPSGTLSQQELDELGAIIIGDRAVNGRLEAQLLDRFEVYEYKRMWWPMQAYFGLSAEDINNLFDFEQPLQGEVRQGIFDILWRRDYDLYERSSNEWNALYYPPEDVRSRPASYSLTEWQVSDPLWVYVRKDIAAEVWPYGMGEAEALNPFTSVQPNVCLENYRQIYADLVFDDSIQPLARPVDMHITQDGRVFVANESEPTSRISVFSTDGRLLNSFGQLGTREEVGAFFNRPHAVFVDPEDRIFVADTWNYQIRVLDPNYEIINLWGSPQPDGAEARTNPTDGFYGPRDVLVGPNGLVYVSDTGNKRIRVYQPDGQWVFDIGSAGAGDGNLNEPSGIVIDPATNRLFVADMWNRRIAVFDANTGQHLTNYPVRAWANKDAPNRPYLALDAQRDLLYVTDPEVGRVLVLDTAGNCLGSFGGYTEVAPDTSQFGVIGSIATDAEGNVYVSDMTYNRIMRFAPFLERDASGLSGLPGDPERTAEVDAAG